MYEQHRQQHQPQQQHQQSHDAFLIPQSQQFGNAGGAENALYAGGAGSASASPLCGMGEYLADHSSTAGSTPAGAGQHSGFSSYGNSPLPLSQETSSGADDLTAYMQQLDTLSSLQHGGGGNGGQQQSFSSYEDPSGLGLGLGVGGGAGGDVMMGLEPGYYGDDGGFGAVGA
jgi:hypothetical protein